MDQCYRLRDHIDSSVSPARRRSLSRQPAKLRSGNRQPTWSDVQQLRQQVRNLAAHVETLQDAVKHLQQRMSELTASPQRQDLREANRRHD